ncbi:unnamed protein product [Musa acuminata subsp. malaccensis]|uniref:(wild Malaysian banana) hypothetical protein n=1 Tax=Musa acuminata subsp. malaccensis TaxID=214687 RepID=A0A804JUI9_MUSAM|nr:unnamed protein product [Musa acuminata subsp. malaccensis]
MPHHSAMQNFPIQLFKHKMIQQIIWKQTLNDHFMPY